MDERDGAISNDFGNSGNLFYQYDDSDDVDEQLSPKMSPFGSPQNGNGFGNGTVDDEQEDTTDSLPLDLFSKKKGGIFSRFGFSNGKSEPPRQPTHLHPNFVPTVKSKRHDLKYNMDHKRRGKCVIINNTYFDSPTLPERKGTLVDRDRLSYCFKCLGFDVQNWDEKEALEIRLGIDKLAREDFTEHDCLVVCVLTHGDSNCLYAKDDKYNVEYLFDAFKSDLCKTLAGKPKIFIIQACRGDRLDNGSIINFDVEDSNSFDVRIPQWADYLMAYSTVPGYYSWRNTTNGSWFIQAFVTALSQHFRELDLLSIFTITNQKVAYDFESNTPNLPDFHQRKQIPMIASMLTRQVYFNKPKPKPINQVHRVSEKSKPSCSVASVSATIASFNQLSVGDQYQLQQQLQRQQLEQEQLQQERYQYQQLQQQFEEEQKLQLEEERKQQEKALRRRQKEEFLRSQALLNEKMISSEVLKKATN